MAIDNFVSYSRFNNDITPNIAEHGATLEELRTQGAPEPNPIHSPMAAPEVSNIRLALSPEGSDRLRLAGPLEPVANVYEGPKRSLALTRSFLTKLGGSVLAELKQVIPSVDMGGPAIRANVDNSFLRVDAMKEFVAFVAVMTGSIDVNRLSSSKA